MRLTLIILVLLAVGMPAFGIDLVTDDHVFSKTVTLDFKGEALADVTRLLSNAAGVSIRASRDVEDQKVTILVDKMPLRDVMNGLATLFGWDWMVQTEDDHDIYIIYDPLKKKREADRQEALDKAWQALGAKLDSLALNPQAPSGDGIASFSTMIALLQYRSLSPELRKEYLSGMRICYSLKSPSAVWRPSQAVMDGFANAESRLKKPAFAKWETDFAKPGRVRIELASKVSADRITALSKVGITYDNPDPDPNDPMQRGFSMMSGDHEGYLHLCTQDIDYPSETLESTLPNKPADGLLSKNVSISAADLVAEGAIGDEGAKACSATRTDLLAALHTKLGLQIISDYYSSWGQFGDAKGTLKQLIEEKPLPGLPANWGWDGNILYMRVKDIRKADSREIPNRFLRPWQAVVKRQDCRGLEELAQAAAFLSGDQREAILDDCHYLKLGECKEIEDLGGWESPVLRLYGLLTSKQKKDIFAGGVGVIGLTTEQRNALAAVINSILNTDRTGVYSHEGLSASGPPIVGGPSGKPAVALTMTCSGSFIYLKPGDDIESLALRKVTATTPEEALRTAQDLGADTDPQNVVALDDIVYTLQVTYEGYTPDETPELFGEFGASAHSTYHRVRIKVPDRKKQ